MVDLIRFITAPVCSTTAWLMLTLASTCPAVTLLHETFDGTAEGSTVPAAGWTNTNQDAPPENLWRFASRPTDERFNTAAATRLLGRFAVLDDDLFGEGEAGATNTSLTTPPFDLTGDYAHALLTFSEAYRSNGASLAIVEVSTDGTTWTAIRTTSEASGVFRGLEAPYFIADFAVVTTTLDLLPFVGQPEVRVRFRFDDLEENSWGWFWLIDDVKVTASRAFEIAVGTFPVNENFDGTTEGSTTPPESWLNLNEDPPAENLWRFYAKSNSERFDTSGIVGFSGNYAALDDQSFGEGAAGAANASLVLPPIDLSGPFASAALTFDEAYRALFTLGGGPSTDAAVEVSTDGTIWEPQYYSPNQGTFSEGGPPYVIPEDATRKVTMDLSEWLGNDSVRVRFRFSDKTPDALGWYWLIDNVRVAITPRITTVEGDLGTTATLSFPVTILPAPHSDFTFSYEIASDTGNPVYRATPYNTANRYDFPAPTTGTFTFVGDGSTTVRYLPVEVVGDVFLEHDEEFTLRLSDPSDGVLISDQAVGRITDDDYTVVLSEDFSTAGPSTPPAGWTAQSIAGTGSGTWTFPDLVPEDILGSPLFKEVSPIVLPAAVLNSGVAGNVQFPAEVDVLVSPPFDLSGASIAVVAFDEMFFPPPVGRIEVSTDGTTWTTLLEYRNRSVGFPPLGESQRTVVDLSEYAGQSNVRIRWWIEHAGFNGWIVDNIKVLKGNHPEGFYNVSIADASADESVGNMDFTVSLTDPAESVITVDYAVVPGRAASPEDVTDQLTGSIEIAVGNSTGTISVPITADEVPEAVETFTVEITGFSGATLNLTDGSAVGTIHDDDIPPGQTCADAAVIPNTSFPVTIYGDTSVELALPTFGLVTGEYVYDADLYYSFTAPATGSYSFSLTHIETPFTNTARDVFILPTSICDTLANAGGAPIDLDFRSVLGNIEGGAGRGVGPVEQFVPLEAGQEVLLIVGGGGALFLDGVDEGPFELTVTDNISTPPNDLCENAEELAVGTVAGTTFGAGQSIFNGLFLFGGDVFYNFAAPQSGRYTFTITPSADYAPVVALLNSCSNRRFFKDTVFNSALEGASGTSVELTALFEAGESAVLYVGALQYTYGDFEITVSLTGPFNDDCDTATEVTVGSVSGSTVGGNATLSGEEGGIVLDSPDVFYSFTAPSDGNYTFMVDPAVEEYNPVIGLVVPGCNGFFKGLPFVDDGSPGEPEEITVRFIAGETAKIYIGGTGETSGHFNLRITGPPPSVGDTWMIL